MARNQPFQGPPGYECLEELGVGSYGEVFLVKRPVPDCPGEFETVAVKRITDFANKTFMHGGDQVAFLRRICREVCSLEFFSSCNFVVEALDFYLGPNDMDLFIVMAFYNMSMYHLFERPEHADLKKFLQESHIRWMMCQVLCGLLNMHTSGVMHRDMTLGNLLMNKDTFECVIADFGLSRVQLDCEPEISLNVVSLTYRSPEIILSSRPYTDALDVWSCGVILAQLLTKTPFLQLKKEHEDAPAQLWAILDTFAGFPTLEELDYWENKKGASKFVINYLRGHRLREARINEIEQLEAQLTAAGADATNEGSLEDKQAVLAAGAACARCSNPLGDVNSFNVVTDPASGQKYGFRKQCYLDWKLATLAQEKAQHRKETPRALPVAKPVGQVLQEKHPGMISDAAADVLNRMLVFDPDRRASLKEVLSMPWWHSDDGCRDLINEELSREIVKCPDEVERMDYNQLIEYMKSKCTMNGVTGERFAPKN